MLETCERFRGSVFGREAAVMKISGKRPGAHDNIGVIEGEARLEAPLRKRRSWWVEVGEPIGTQVGRTEVGELASIARDTARIMGELRLR